MVARRFCRFDKGSRRGHVLKNGSGIDITLHTTKTSTILSNTETRNIAQTDTETRQGK